MICPLSLPTLSSPSPVLTLLQTRWLICYSWNSPKGNLISGSPHLLFPLLGMFFLWIATRLFSPLSGLCVVFLFSLYPALFFSIIFFTTWHIYCLLPSIIKYKLQKLDFVYTNASLAPGTIPNIPPSLFWPLADVGYICQHNAKIMQSNMANFAGQVGYHEVDSDAGEAVSDKWRSGRVRLVNEQR